MIKNARGLKSFISLLLLSVMLLGMGIPAVCAQAAPISDIGSHWAKKEVTSWIEKGFIEGYPDDTFKPDNTISRAEFIKLVNRLFGFSEKASVPFTDVKESDWFYPEFAKAGKVGYLDGYEAGKINPNGFITRQEVAVIAAKVKSLEEDAAAADGFLDSALIPAKSKGFIGAIAKAKVMNGYPNEKFEPAKGITRAESVITLNRLFNLKDSVKIEAINGKYVTKGSTSTVAVKIVPADAKISVESSDSKVVEATVKGTDISLKGLAEGSATITVTGKKVGMLDGVVSFKVSVNKATSGGGGGGKSSGVSNPPVPPPVDYEAKLTELKAVVGAATAVTGKYGSGVTKVEVIYGSTTLPAVLANGTFSCSITPGLAIGEEITAKAYDINTLLDANTVKVVEDDSMITGVKAKGTTATEISGNYANGVTRVTVIYNGLTKEAELNSDGTFHWNVFPGFVYETDVTVQGYVGALLVDIDVIKAGTAVPEPGSYLTGVKAVGTLATAVTGSYADGITKVEVIYKGLTKEAKLNSDGTFSWSIFPGLASGTAITVKAYVGANLVETKSIVSEGGTEPEPKDYLSNLKAVGTIATAVTGSYAEGVTKVEVLYNGLTKEAKLNSDETFSWSIFPGLASGTAITVKAYVGANLVETKSIVSEGGTEPEPKDYLSNLKAVGTIATAVTGSYAEGVTKVEVLYNTLTKAANMYPDGTFSWSIFPGLPSGTEVIIKAYVGIELKDTVAVNVQ